MQYVILYMGMLFLGYFISSRLRAHAERFEFLSKALMAIVYVLVFIMGLRMGINEQVTSNLGSIGLQALVLTVCCIAGSMLAVFGVRKMMGMDRYGDMIKAGVEAHAAESPEAAGADGMVSEGGRTAESIASAAGDAEGQDSSDLKSTLIILALVVIGMAAGYFFIADLPADRLQRFDTVSSSLLTVFLCMLLFTVGFDMGRTETVGRSIRSIGLRALAFPVAAIAGTLALGAACAVIMGFSLKEGLAMSAGFGWYTYAPTVISDAGSRYMIASAVAFMHNVLREVSGIVLIPVMAKRFGYIESTAVPGVAAADVCVPIVEKSCRPDTVVYSITMGIAMTLATSIFVPLFMGL